jgi:hypothetical protein
MRLYSLLFCAWMLMQGTSSAQSIHQENFPQYQYGHFKPKRISCFLTGGFNTASLQTAASQQKNNFGASLQLGLDYRPLYKRHFFIQLRVNPLLSSRLLHTQFSPQRLSIAEHEQLFSLGLRKVFPLKLFYTHHTWYLSTRLETNFSRHSVEIQPQNISKFSSLHTIGNIELKYQRVHYKNSKYTNTRLYALALAFRTHYLSIQNPTGFEAAAQSVSRLSKEHIGIGGRLSAQVRDIVLWADMRYFWSLSPHKSTLTGLDNTLLVNVGLNFLLEFLELRFSTATVSINPIF